MPSAQQFQQLIIAALSAADSEAQSDLQIKVPVFWNLYAVKAALPDLRYWYTYRESVKMLMARNARKVDQTRRSSLSVGQQKNDVTSDGSTLTEASTNSAELGSSSTVRHSSRALTGLSLANSGESMSGTDQSTDDVNYYDIGAGSGTTTTRAHKNFGTARNHYSLNDGLVKGTIDASDNAWRAVNTRLIDPYQGFTHHVTRVSTAVAVAASTTTNITDLGSAVTQSDTDGVHTYSRIGGMKTDSDSSNYNDSSLVADRSFTANVFDATYSSRNGASSGTMFGSNSVTEDLTGSGTMTHHSRHTLQGLTISQTQTHDVTTGASQSLETSQATMLMQRLQQQYTHLKELFVIATQQIAMREKQAVSERRHVLVVMSAQSPDSPGSDANLQMNPCLPLLYNR